MLIHRVDRKDVLGEIDAYVAQTDCCRSLPSQGMHFASRSSENGLVNLTSPTLIPGEIDPDRPWIGKHYQPKRSIFVLGESYVGSYEGEMEYDDAYWQKCLEDPAHTDPLFVALQEKLGIPGHQWWPTIAFTNLCIGTIGPTTETVVTPAQLRAGLPRLGNLLDRLQPGGVLVLGAATRDVAGPFLSKRGVLWRSVYHPSGKNNWMLGGRYACTPEMLQSAWLELTGQGGT